MKLSDKAWEISKEVIDAIQAHPFNQELAKGILDKEKFAYYIEQDILYLKDFARCHAIIAAKAPHEHVRTFLQYADYTFVAEQEIVHQFFRQLYGLRDTGFITPATLAYTSFLKNTCSLEPVEVAIASVLPCFWVYREVGLAIVQQTIMDNPFSRWIETYSSEDFAASVEEAINIFDDLARNTTDDLRDKMLKAFYNSTVLEWHFWNDAYNFTSIDGFIANTSFQN